MPLRTPGTPITPPVVPLLAVEKILPVDLVVQIANLWCWAATAEMILDYYDHPEPHLQCEIANVQVEIDNQQVGNDCCGDPFQSECNKSISTRAVGDLYRDRNLTATLRGPVSFAKLKEEIDADRPVLVGYQWSGGGKHLAVVFGYSQNDENLLLVNDPWPDIGVVDTDYDSLKNAYNLGTWIKTWIELE